ncbi:MAG TPA: acyltransferase [Acetobacteraceae bacterium]|nr:acyltransferase [Acetobacteraceae bacterium]
MPARAYYTSITFPIDFEAQRVRCIPALDGLRAVAITLVFLFHRGAHFPGGWIGVDIFFVLSGYLITSLLLQEYEHTGRVDIGSFYARRACRLLPALTIVVIASVGMAIWFDTRPLQTEWDAAAALFYFLDYRYAFGGFSVTSLVHAWSLSVEEQFYFVWPPLLLILLPRGKRFVLRSALVLIMIVVIWREYLILTSPDAFFRTYFAFDTRADELLLGCALALWRPRHETIERIRHFWPGVVLLLAAVVVLFNLRTRSLQLTEAIGFPLISIAAAYIIAVLTTTTDTWLSQLLSYPPLVALGHISYGFYLWHWVIIFQANNLHIDETWLVFVVSVAAAAVSYAVIERPFLLLGRRRWAVPRLRPQTG